MIGRAKFSESTKKKILACVNRKAKKLGCESKAKDSDFEKQVEEIINGEYGQQAQDLLEWLEEIDEENLVIQNRLAGLVSKTGVEPISEDTLKTKDSNYLIDLLEQFVNDVLKAGETDKAEK